MSYSKREALLLGILMGLIFGASVIYTIEHKSWVSAVIGLWIVSCAIIEFCALPRIEEIRSSIE